MARITQLVSAFLVLGSLSQNYQLVSATDGNEQLLQAAQQVSDATVNVGVEAAKNVVHLHRRLTDILASTFPATPSDASTKLKKRNNNEIELEDEDNFLTIDKESTDGIEVTLEPIEETPNYIKKLILPVETLPDKEEAEDVFDFDLDVEQKRARRLNRRNVPIKTPPKTGAEMVKEDTNGDDPEDYPPEDGDVQPKPKPAAGDEVKVPDTEKPIPGSQQVETKGDEVKVPDTEKPIPGSQQVETKGDEVKVPDTEKPIPASQQVEEKVDNQADGKDDEDDGDSDDDDTGTTTTTDTETEEEMDDEIAQDPFGDDHIAEEEDADEDDEEKPKSFFKVWAFLGALVTGSVAYLSCRQRRKIAKFFGNNKTNRYQLLSTASSPELTEVCVPSSEKEKQMVVSAQDSVLTLNA